MKFVIAERHDRWGVRIFRVYDTDTRTYEDMENTKLTIAMTNGLKLGNMKLTYEDRSPFRIFSDFKAMGCDASYMPIITQEGDIKANKDCVIVTNIEGEYVDLVNWEGKSCRVHMLQAANNVRNKKVVLINARVRSDGWILPGKWS